MVFKGIGTWTRQVGRQEEAVMMVLARDHCGVSGSGGHGLFEVGDVALIVESCLPGVAYWMGKEVFLDGGGRRG